MKKINELYKTNKEIFHNNKKSCRLENIEEIDINNVSKIIDELFNDSGYSYEKEVIIKTKDKSYQTCIITRRGDYIYTLEDDKIQIKDIISIERI